MPHVDGEFASYFSNVTETLMFCWVQKHNICKLQLFDQIVNDFSANLHLIHLIATQAYDELVDIIRHPQFKGEDVVSNSC